jgi:hypothetical protein
VLSRTNIIKHLDEISYLCDEYISMDLDPTFIKNISKIYKSIFIWQNPIDFIIFKLYLSKKNEEKNTISESPAISDKFFNKYKLKTILYIYQNVQNYRNMRKT